MSLAGISAGMGVLAYLGGAESRQAEPRPPTETARVPATVTALIPANAAKAAGPSSATIAATAATDFARRWAGLSAGPRTPASEQRMAAALAELAETDPAQALALAHAEANVRLRQNLRQAALRGWAATRPADAAAWALILPDGEQELALQAVFGGAARHPAEAVDLFASLSAQLPAFQGDFGQFLLNGLTEAGAYESAARFAQANPSAHQGAWLNTAYFHWATHQPAQARAAFEAISDPAERLPAFQGLILGWAMADPAAVADYAVRLAPGEDRGQALTQALPQWVNRDPVAASEWMLRHFDPDPDLDAGVAAVATKPNLINTWPEIAVGWAEGIAEPVLRANTLRLIALQWAQRDAPAFRHFIASAADLLPSDRTALMDGLNPPPDT